MLGVAAISWDIWKPVMGVVLRKKNALRTLLKLCMLHVLLLGRALLGEHAMGDHGGCWLDDEDGAEASG
jgi:hypothetical protein